MSAESGLISFRHKSYGGELFIRHHDVTEAARKIGRLIGIRPPGESNPAETVARNILFAMVDRENEAHPLMLGGVAIGPDLSTTFWSSPHTEHSELIEEGRQAAVLISHTHMPNTSLRMKQMGIVEVAPEDVDTYLAELNGKRAVHGLHTRELEEFRDTEAPKSLYIATPSDNPLMTTVPVSAYTRKGDELTWMRSVSYPITAAEIFHREPDAADDSL
jgi:hypothetical protein